MTFPNSESQVVSTVALALKAFLDIVSEEITNVNIVYDEGLSFEKAVTALRANNNLGGTKSGVYPLFVFKRSVLRHAKDGQGRRSVTNRVRGTAKPDTGNVPVYRCISGEFDIQFMYVAKTMENLERFEIAYLGEESFSEDRELVVPLPELQTDLKYYISPSPLEEKTVESEGVYYKAVTGSLTVRGFYLVFREELKHIESIRMRVLEFNKNVLASRTIP